MYEQKNLNLIESLQKNVSIDFTKSQLTLDQREVSFKIDNENETTDGPLDPNLNLLDLDGDLFDDPEHMQFKEKLNEETVDFFDFTTATHEKFASYMTKIHGGDFE